MWGNAHFSMFRSSAPKKPKTENARPQNNKGHYISIKTHGTGGKLYNTSQSYLSIPLFYPMWGSTHYSMFSYFGFQWIPENTKPGMRPEKQ